MTDTKELFLITGATGNTGAHTVSCCANVVFASARSCTPLMSARPGYVNWAPKSCKATCWTFPRSAPRRSG